MKHDVEIEISGVSRREKANLLEHVQKDLVEFRAPAMKPGELGDPTLLVAVIGLTVISVTGILAWVAKQGVSVKASGAFKGPTGHQSSFNLVLGPKSTVDQVKADLAKQGVALK